MVSPNCPDSGLTWRQRSRFHRTDFARLVPSLVPAAEDLAHGADVKLIDERTVAVIPVGAETAKDRRGQPRSYVQAHLIFNADGALVERQIVLMPANRVLARQFIGTQPRNFPAVAPSLTPDLEKLVVLNLPYRSADHARQKLKNCLRLMLEREGRTVTGAPGAAT